MQSASKLMLIFQPREQQSSYWLELYKVTDGRHIWRRQTDGGCTIYKKRWGIKSIKIKSSGVIRVLRRSWWLTWAAGIRRHRPLQCACYSKGTSFNRLCWGCSSSCGPTRPVSSPTTSSGCLTPPASATAIPATSIRGVWFAILSCHGSGQLCRRDSQTSCLPGDLLG